MADFTVPVTPSDAQLPSSLGQSTVSADDYGMGVGKALEARAIKRQTDLDRAAAMEFESKLQKGLRNNRLDAFKKQGKNALGLTKAESEAWAEGGDVHSTYMEGSEKDSPELQLMKQRSYVSLTNAHLNSIAGYESGQEQVYVEQEKNNATAGYVNAGIDSGAGDFSTLELSIAKIDAIHGDDKVSAGVAKDIMLDAVVKIWIDEDVQNLELIEASEKWFKDNSGIAFKNILATARAEKRRIENDAEVTARRFQAEEGQRINIIMRTDATPATKRREITTSGMKEEYKKPMIAVVDTIERNELKELKSADDKTQQDALKNSTYAQLTQVLENSPNDFKTDLEIWEYGAKGGLSAPTIATFVKQWNDRDNPEMLGMKSARKDLNNFKYDTDKVDNIRKRVEHLRWFDTIVEENRNNPDFDYDMAVVEKLKPVSDAWTWKQIKPLLWGRDDYADLDLVDETTLRYSTTERQAATEFLKAAGKNVTIDSLNKTLKYLKDKNAQ